MVGRGGLEPPTSRLSGVRSNRAELPALTKTILERVVQLNLASANHLASLSLPRTHFACLLPSWQKGRVSGGAYPHRPQHRRCEDVQIKQNRLGSPIPERELVEPSGIEPLTS